MKIRKLYRLLKYLKTTKNKYLIETKKGTWELYVRIKDEEIIKFLRKELGK